MCREVIMVMCREVIMINLAVLMILYDSKDYETYCLLSSFWGAGISKFWSQVLRVETYPVFL